METVDLDKLENKAEEERLLKIFNTMSFNGGNVRVAKLVDTNTLYLDMFNEPDMIFYFKSTSDWFLQTAANFVKGHIADDSRI